MGVRQVGLGHGRGPGVGEVARVALVRTAVVEQRGRGDLVVVWGSEAGKQGCPFKEENCRTKAEGDLE